MVELVIMSADAKRKENETRRIMKQMEEEAHEAMRPLRVENLTVQIFNLAKSRIEVSTFDYCEVLITDGEIRKWGWPADDELMEAIERVRLLLSVAGYQCNDWHEYSKSWHTRSGKVGYLYVRW